METLNHNKYPAYSVAIRTLGLAPALLRRTLASIYVQSVAPAKVVVYIAEGYDIPAFREGDEQYVATRKGMVAQRAMLFSEITTPLILMLDDDVMLASDSVERLLDALVDHHLDCIASDTFANHRLPTRAKLFAAVTNLTFPHRSTKYAFKIHSNGSFSYINHPEKNVYISQTAAGPCSLWRKEALLATSFADETWMDRMGFAYNDDGMEFYKLYCNGGRLGVHFNSGITNMDARTMSATYRSDPRRFALRAKAIYLCWHRSLYRSGTSRIQRMARWMSFWMKAGWLLPVHMGAAVAMKDPSIPLLYLQELRDGIRYTRTQEYEDLPSYRK